jgi:prevent-host-death family protein
MFTTEEKTTLVGITDLRTQAKKMLECLKDSRVIITERNAPRAVVIDYDNYQKMRELIELAEEAMDAPEVHKRKKKNKGRFLSHKELVNAVL